MSKEKEMNPTNITPDKKEKKIKAWAHLEMVNGRPFKIYFGDKPVCKHGEDFGLECIIPVVISYKKS